MSYTPLQLKTFHKASIYNKGDIEISEQCGCFYCEKTFPAKDVVKYIDKGRTGVCPLCDIDAVLPDATVTVTPELLSAMYWKWFVLRSSDGQETS